MRNEHLQRRDVAKHNAREFIAKVPEDREFSVGDLRSFHNAKVLIVEDNEINLRMVLKVLEYSKMSLKTARNGKEAIDILKKLDRKDIDLVLMDINMPVMDGYNATKLIRQDSRWQDLPIVALSALNLKHEIEKMNQVGMNAFLPKPLNLKQLYTILKLYLKEDKDSTTKKTKKTKKNEKNENLKLDGFVLKRAMINLGHDKNILKDVMRRFKTNYSYSDKRLSFYIKMNDVKMLKKTLIDLMGLTGTIGAVNLNNIIRDMYKDFIFSRFDKIEERIPEYTNELNKVCSSINKFLNMA